MLFYLVNIFSNLCDAKNQQRVLYLHSFFVFFLSFINAIMPFLSGPYIFICWRLRKYDLLTSSPRMNDCIESVQHVKKFAWKEVTFTFLYSFFIIVSRTTSSYSYVISFSGEFSCASINS